MMLVSAWLSLAALMESLSHGWSYSYPSMGCTRGTMAKRKEEKERWESCWQWPTRMSTKMKKFSRCPCWLNADPGFQSAQLTSGTGSKSGAWHWHNSCLCAATSRLSSNSASALGPSSAAIAAPCQERCGFCLLNPHQDHSSSASSLQQHSPDPPMQLSPHPAAVMFLRDFLGVTSTSAFRFFTMTSPSLLLLAFPVPAQEVLPSTPASNPAPGGLLPSAPVSSPAAIGCQFCPCPTLQLSTWSSRLHSFLDLRSSGHF